MLKVERLAQNRKWILNPRRKSSQYSLAKTVATTQKGEAKELKKKAGKITITKKSHKSPSPEISSRNKPRYNQI